ncbi:MAG: Flp family type IVb pilin [Acidimicrobiia bacterium]|nr:Flp family type IVb pilin [Acidimicrobiia bacterium]MDH3463116.1 Flp family type IVb pilin [Acidimicrobiia bacterium]
MRKLALWLKAEKGASMVEYALLVVLIAIVALVAVTVMGGQVSELYSGIGSDLLGAKP